VRVKIVPLEEVLRREAFEKGVVEKVEEGVYRVHCGVTLRDSVIMAEAGWATIIVAEKGVTVAENFFPPEDEREGVREVYLVRLDKACDFIERLHRERGIPLTYTAKWWCGWEPLPGGEEPADEELEWEEEYGDDEDLEEDEFWEEYFEEEDEEDEWW